MRLQVSKTKNSASFYVVKSVYENGKRSNKVVEKLGTEAEIREKHPDQDPYTWAKEYVDELNKKQKESKSVIITNFNSSKRKKENSFTAKSGGCIPLRYVLTDLGIYDICNELEKKYNLKYCLFDIVHALISNKILSSSSQLLVTDYAKSMVNAPDFKEKDVHSALRILSAEDRFIQTKFYENLKKKDYIGKDTVMFYCNNNYYDLQSVSEHSKSGRFNNMVQIALMLDSYGIPMGYTYTSMDNLESLTFSKDMMGIMKEFKGSEYFVCCDAGLQDVLSKKMSVVKNKHFVISVTLNNLAPLYKDAAQSPNDWICLEDGKKYNLFDVIFDENLYMKFRDQLFYKEMRFVWPGHKKALRFILIFSIRNLVKERHAKEAQLQKAHRNLSKTWDSGFRKEYRQFALESNVIAYSKDENQLQKVFNTVVPGSISPADGIFGLLTDYEGPAEDIIDLNRKNGYIEMAFSTINRSFRPNPTSVPKEDCMAAHFLISFLSIATYRHLKHLLDGKYKYQEIVQHLREMNYCSIFGEGFIPLFERCEYYDDIQRIMGTELDTEIVTKKKMNEILKGNC